MILGAYIVLCEIYGANLSFALKISKKLLLFLRDFEREWIKGLNGCLGNQAQSLGILF